jgi:GNAT superfamily N-acetyltransferase
MIGLQIARADQADFRALYSIFQQATPDRPHAEEHGFLRSQYDEDAFAAFLSRCVVYHATVRREPAGFVVVEPLRFTDLPEIAWEIPPDEVASLAQRALLWLRMAAVAPAFSRQGVGTALYQHVQQCYTSWDLLTGLYEQPLNNLASRQFHASLGFQRIGEVRRQYPGEATKRVSGIYHLPPRHGVIQT